MKRIFLTMVAAAGMLFATSCAKDVTADAALSAGDTATVTFALDAAEVLATRAIGDGSSTDQLVFQTFDAEYNPVMTEGYNGTKSVAAFPYKDLSLSFVKGQTYYVAFWAQNSDCTAYTTTDLKNVTVDYSALNNDDSRDAFCAVVEINISADEVKSVTLRRPFAQINLGIIESDIEAAALFGVSVASTTVSLENVPTQFNLLDGTTGEPENIEAATADVDADETFTVGSNTYHYASSIYVLAPAEKSVVENLVYTITLDNGSEIEVSQGLQSVPVQRNWRTNIIGRFLTGKVDFDIDFSSQFDDDINLDIAKVGTFEEANEALANGATAVTITESPSKAEELLIPHNYASETVTLQITLPASEHTVTAKYDDMSANAPQSITFNTSGTTKLELQTDHSTVILGGEYSEVGIGASDAEDAGTAANDIQIAGTATLGAVSVKTDAAFTPAGMTRAETGATLTDSQFVLGSNGNLVKATFEGLKFTGDSYINEAYASALTVRNCEAKVSPTLNCNGRRAFIGCAPEASHGIELTIENNIIDSANSSDDSYSAALFIQNFIKSASIVGNTFGTKENPYRFIAVKLMNAVDGAVYTIEDNTAYGTDQYFYFQAFDLYQNNSRNNTYTAVFSNNKVYSEEASSSYYNRFLCVEVNGNTGNGQVLVLGNNTINDKAVELGDMDIDVASSLPYRYVGWGVDDAENITKGSFIIREGCEPEGIIASDYHLIETEVDAPESVLKVDENAVVWEVAPKNVYYITPKNAAAFNKWVDGDSYYLRGKFAAETDIPFVTGMNLEINGSFIIDNCSEEQDLHFRFLNGNNFPNHNPSWLEENTTKTGTATFTGFKGGALSVQTVNTTISVKENTLTALDIAGGNLAINISDNNIDANNKSHRRYDGGTNERGVYIYVVNYELEFERNTINNVNEGGALFIHGWASNGNNWDKITTPNSVNSFTGNSLTVCEYKSGSEDDPSKATAAITFMGDITYNATSAEDISEGAKEFMEMVNKDTSNKFYIGGEAVAANKYKFTNILGGGDTRLEPYYDKE